MGTRENHWATVPTFVIPGHQDLNPAASKLETPFSITKVLYRMLRASVSSFWHGGWDLINYEQPEPGFHPLSLDKHS